ncbi:thiamine diphosphokinase [Camelliibacillus cellulosilyticus]|uniref:Thiamine diphosphokinase n=1 Tax=Camelliibacillus cellulosilyticus TaxID=2174486 RepID=A0ABV9GKV0_9BACL
MDYAILAGGPPAHLPDLKKPPFENVQWLGADRGTYRLLEHGIRPVKAFGDFDSIDERERHLIGKMALNLDVFPTEKDQTDLEIAVDWALKQEPRRCWIVGATGGRLDHTLINVQFLIKGASISTEVLLIDKQNIVTLLTPGVYNIEKTPAFPYVSLIAFTTHITGITLDGFKYPLKNAELSRGSSLCVSNEIVREQATIRIGSGEVLLIRSRDERYS